MTETTVETLTSKSPANDADPLTRRRKNSSAAQKKTKVDSDQKQAKPEYKASSTEAAATSQAQHQLDNLELRTRKNPAGEYVIPYDLIRLVHAPTPQLITIYCVGYIVTIEGNHLNELKKQIAARKAAYIQEFNVKGIDKLAKGTPVVYEINVLFGNFQQQESCE